MKHTLPWNVTGIPPEVRELARAAALREGTSVGEWLTRRIMAEAGEPANPERQAPSASPFPSAREEPARPREESATRSLRLDVGADPVFRRIDEAFRNLANRLENTERAQIDAHRAMNAAACEINAATRDQAEAFQLITTRIQRVERQTDTGALRDAVRGLHQGLSRLAEQIAKTTHESSGGIAALSSTVEMLAGRMAGAGEEYSQHNHAIEERFAALDGRIKYNEDRLRQTEERLAAALRTDEAVAMLETRMHSTEERMQESLGRYLSGIERNLEQMGERLQKTEMRGEPDHRIEEALQNLAARLGAVESKEHAPAPQSGMADAITLIEAAVESAVPAGVPDLAEFRLTQPEAIALEPLSAPQEEMLSPPTQMPPLVPESDASNPLATMGDALGRERSETEPADMSGNAPMSGDAPLSGDDYLAQARRAARGPKRSGRSMRSGIGIRSRREPAARQRIWQGLSMTFLFLLLMGAGFVLTRAVQNHADVLAFDPSQLLAFAAPAASAPVATAGTRPANSSVVVAAPVIPGTPISEPAEATTPTITAPADSVASASVLPLGLAGDTPLAQLVAKANGGDSKIAMQLGLKYVDGDGVAANDIEAFFWLQKAAEAGEAVAQYRLGTLYERGRGVPADTRQALHWYGEAAKRGNRRAMHNLAVVYADGASPDRNFPEALRWFKDAAELGLTDSQFNLAVLYERGLGVKPSLAEAYKWYEIAAASGDDESKARLTTLTKQITPEDRDAAERAAKAYKPRPIDLAANDG